MRRGALTSSQWAVRSHSLPSDSKGGVKKGSGLLQCALTVARMLLRSRDSNNSPSRVHSRSGATAAPTNHWRSGWWDLRQQRSLQQQVPCSCRVRRLFIERRKTRLQPVKKLLESASCWTGELV